MRDEHFFDFVKLLSRIFKTVAGLLDAFLRERKGLYGK